MNNSFAKEPPDFVNVTFTKDPCILTKSINPQSMNGNFAIEPTEFVNVNFKKDS